MKLVRGSSSSVSPLCSNLEDVLVFQKELQSENDVAARGELDILDESQRLHVAGKVWCSSPEKLHAILPFKCLSLVHNTLHELEKWYVKSEKVDSEFLWRLVIIISRTNNNFSSIPADVADVRLVRYCLQWRAGQLVESSQHVEVVTPLPNLEMPDFMHHHSPFLNLQNV